MATWKARFRLHVCLIKLFFHIFQLATASLDRGFRAQRFYLKKIQIFQETSFCVLQVLPLDFTNTIWQLYIDFLHRSNRL